MTYNKSKEERKWKHWKEQEENQLRKLGVSKTIIDSLHQSDWSVFNADRRYKEHEILEPSFIEQKEEIEKSADILNVHQLLEDIDNEQLLHILMSADKKTLQIILLKMMGFSVAEISKEIGLSEKAIYHRLERLKKKIKKIL